jgi:hypothetical protein
MEELQYLTPFLFCLNGRCRTRWAKRLVWVAGDVMLATIPLTAGVVMLATTPLTAGVVAAAQRQPIAVASTASLSLPTSSSYRLRISISHISGHNTTNIGSILIKLI